MKSGTYGERQRNDFLFTGLYYHSLKGVFFLDSSPKGLSFDEFFLLRPSYSEGIHVNDSYAILFGFYWVLNHILGTRSNFISRSL